MGAYGLGRTTRKPFCPSLSAATLGIYSQRKIVKPCKSWIFSPFFTAHVSTCINKKHIWEWKGWNDWFFARFSVFSIDSCVLDPSFARGKGPKELLLLREGPSRAFLSCYFFKADCIFEVGLSQQVFLREKGISQQDATVEMWSVA